LYNYHFVGWRIHFASFVYILLQIHRGNHDYIVSPSFWFNFQRYYLLQQLLSNIGSPHCSTNKCLPMFYNVCKQRLVPCRPFLCFGYSWHYLLYSFLNYEIMLPNSTTIDSFLLRFILHIVELLDLVIFVNLGSPFNSCSSPFYYSSWKFVSAIDLNIYNNCFCHIWILTLS